VPFPQLYKVFFISFKTEEKLWKIQGMKKGFNLASSVKYTESFFTAIQGFSKGFSEINSRFYAVISTNLFE
jgi:hypothetical protein